MNWNAAVLCFALAGCSAAPPLTGAGTRVIAHRGSTGPDGTVAGCLKSLAMGVTFVELDVRLTRDGQAVVLHDSTVDRTTDGSGRVDAMTLAELKKLDAGSKYAPRFAGERVPTVAEVLRAVGDRAIVLLELKDPRAAGPVIEAIRAEGAYKTAVVRNADLALLRKIRDDEPRVMTGAMGQVPDEVDGFVARLSESGVSSFTPRKNERLTTGVIRKLNAAGIAAWGTNTNDPAAMSALVASGADGIITDRPGLLQRFLGRREPPLEAIRLSDDGRDFVREGSGKPFRAWGVNYDHDGKGRLLEDYWREEWPTVVEDFHEIDELGANVVRIHLQVGKFMAGPDDPNPEALRMLDRLVDLAEATGLYLDLTGLGCYHKEDVPPWYDALSEAKRWEVQARFWEAVAETCAGSPAIFCYDLMNEPILAGKKGETDWLGGAFGGKYFVQRITLDLAGRTRIQVAEAWVRRLVKAIRKHDSRTMVTVGVIPWALTFRGAKPIFYAPEVAAHLDYVSVHFYPRKGEVPAALEALAVYDIGKPVVIEETFALKCSQEEMEAFIEGSKKHADGWISFYWGESEEDLAKKKNDLPAAIFRRWLKWFREKAPGMRGE